MTSRSIMEKTDSLERRRQNLSKSKASIRNLLVPSLLKTLCMSLLGASHIADISDYIHWKSTGRSGSFWITVWMDPLDWENEECDLNFIMVDENTLVSTSFNISKHGGCPHHSLKTEWLVLPDALQ